MMIKYFERGDDWRLFNLMKSNYLLFLQNLKFEIVIVQ